MTLYNSPLKSNNVSINRANHVKSVRPGLETILSKISKCLPNKTIYLAQNLAMVSPWGLYCVYRAAVIYMQLSRETGDLSVAENLRLLKQTLSTMRLRWNAAGTFLALAKEKFWLTGFQECTFSCWRRMKCSSRVLHGCLGHIKSSGPCPDERSWVIDPQTTRMNQIQSTQPQTERSGEDGKTPS
jgi:hypothetical protein